MFHLSPANAGSYQGYVTNVFAVDGRVHIKLDTGAGTSQCGAGTAYYIDVGTEFGRAMLSIAIIAKTTQTLVWVAGTDSCLVGTPYNGSEALAQIDLKG